MCTAFASAQWLNPSWRPFMKTLRGRRVAQNFLRDDNEPGHGGNRLAVVYAKRQPAQSVRAFVRAPAGPSCTRWIADCMRRPAGTLSPGYVLQETRNASVKTPRGYGPSLKSGFSWIRGALSKANISRMHVRQINSNPPFPRSIRISRATGPLPSRPWFGFGSDGESEPRWAA